jgi:hypothetical protein
VQFFGGGEEVLDGFKRGVPRVGDEWEVDYESPSILDGECGIPERGDNEFD